LEADAALPDVPLKPAPWRLKGSAYLLLVRSPARLLAEGAFVPEGLAARIRGRMSCLMLVDYHTSPCGPYRELLVVPSLFAFDQGTYPAITRIFVSSYESVVNGRNNWGIPKDLADFDLSRDNHDSDHCSLSRGGHVFARLSLSARGPSLPVRSGFFPARFRTLIQHFRGQSFRFTFNARGTIRLAKLTRWWFDPAYFPDLAQGRLLLATYLPSFEMEFARASALA
jgi:hypothetical protein